MTYKLNNLILQMVFKLHIGMSEAFFNINVKMRPFVLTINPVPGGFSIHSDSRLTKHLKSCHIFEN